MECKMARNVKGHTHTHAQSLLCRWIGSCDSVCDTNRWHINLLSLSSNSPIHTYIHAYIYTHSQTTAPQMTAAHLYMYICMTALSVPAHANKMWMYVCMPCVEHITPVHVVYAGYLSAVMSVYIMHVMVNFLQCEDQQQRLIVNWDWKQQHCKESCYYGPFNIFQRSQDVDYAGDIQHAGFVQCPPELLAPFIKIT